MKKIICVLIVMILAVGPFAGCTTGNSSAPGFNAARGISVISREDGSGTRGAFIELFGIEEKGADGSKTDKTTKEAIIANKTDIMLTNVAGDPYAIGYVSLGSLNGTVRALSIDSVDATVENIKNGSYKISRPFNIAAKSEISALAQDFIDYILSAEGQAVVAKSYIAVDDAAPAYAGTAPSGKIVVAGSSSVTPIMEKLKEAYLAVNPNAEIEIQQSDSTTGMNAAIDGTCDIGMASRELKDSELEALTPTSIAIDGIAVIVNNQNPAVNMTKEQVHSVFTGGSTKWSDIQ